MKMRSGTMMKLAVGFALLVVATATQAVEPIYVQIEGIEGESQHKNHRGWIEAEAFSQGVTMTGSTHTGGGGGAGRVNFQPITLIKRLDIASPQIWLKLLQGRAVNKVTIEFFQDANDQYPFFKIELKNALFVSVQQGETTDAGEYLEEVQIEFAEIEMTVVQPREDGGQGAEASAGWNLPQNTVN